jgi:polyisoprenoid-binding protein YceI
MNTSVARFLSHWSTAVFAAATLSAVAAASSIDATKSGITATFRQMNVPVEGGFKVFRGSIDFDPKNLKLARARIEIDTASFDLGAPEYEDELRGKEWFDTPTYPKASFVSSSVISVVFEGELSISRKAYAIGSSEWDDTLDDEVIVKFRITTAN